MTDGIAGLDEGETLVDLIFNPRAWIHRRVERIDILPGGDCLRHQSVDFTLPGESTISGSRDSVLVPIGILRKGPLARLDVTGPEGHPIPLLETAQNSDLSAALLRALAARIYRYDPATTEPADLVDALHRLVSGATGEAPRLLAELETVLAPAAGPGGADLGRSTFLAVAGQFVEQLPCRGRTSDVSGWPPVHHQTVLPRATE